MKKITDLITTGFVFLLIGLGCVGLFIPIFPTTPFFILSAAIMAKTNKKLHAWFVSTDLYKNNLESLVKYRAMSKKAKFKILGMVTLALSVGFYFSPDVARIIIVIVGICHYLYFIFRVRTIEEL